MFETNNEVKAPEIQQPEIDNRDSGYNPENDYVKIGGDEVNPESPYVTSRETAENSGYIDEGGNEVIDSEKVQEELSLPDSNPAEYAHEMPHISDETHDLYVSDIAPNFGHLGGGEQTIAIRKEGESLEDGRIDKPEYTPEHKPGEEGVGDNRKQLSDFSDADWESAYVENEMSDSIKEHNEKYSDNQLDFYEISNSGENFKRADGSSALDEYNTKMEDNESKSEEKSSVKGNLQNIKDEKANEPKETGNKNDSTTTSDAGKDSNHSRGSFTSDVNSSNEVKPQENKETSNTEVKNNPVMNNDIEDEEYSDFEEESDIEDELEPEIDNEKVSEQEEETEKIEEELEEEKTEEKLEEEKKAEDEKKIEEVKDKSKENLFSRSF